MRASIPRRLADFLVDSEELGFDALWANEHHFDPYGGIIPSPPIMLAALAQRTKRVRLGTSVIVLPLHQPIEIAEQLAMVDLMSDGRVELGVGRGFVVADYEALGIPREGAQERLTEELEVILKAWSGAPFSHHGKHYDFDNIEVWPPPQQRPHPPVWLSVGATPSSFEWAGRQGYKVLSVAYRGVQQLVELLPLYRNAWLAAGHKAGEWEISSHYQVVLSDNSRKARQIAEKRCDGTWPQPPTLSNEPRRRQRRKPLTDRAWTEKCWTLTAWSTSAGSSPARRTRPFSCWSAPA